MMRIALNVLVWAAIVASLAAFSRPTLKAMRDRKPASAMEESIVAHAKRFAKGEALYEAPAPVTLQPLLPGFPVSLGLIGARPREARALALAALALAALLLAAIVFDETGSRTASGAGAAILVFGGWYLAGPPGTGYAECLALALGIAGFLCMRILGDLLGTLIASLLLTAACLTHPLGVPLLLAAFGHALVRGRFALIGITFGTALFLGVGYVMLSRVLGPSFNYQAWDALVASFRPNGQQFLELASHGLLGTFGVLTLAVVMSFALPVKPWEGVVGVWLWLAAGAIGAMALASQSVALEARALLPAVAALALLGPIAMDRVVRHLSADSNSREWGGRGVLLAALLLQLFQLFMAVPPAAVAMAR